MDNKRLLDNKIIAIIIYNNDVPIKSEFNLGNFFFLVRNSIKELIFFCTKEITKRIDPNLKYKITFDEDHKTMLKQHNLENTICNCYKLDSFTYFIISTNLIPTLIINNMFDELVLDHVIMHSMLNRQITVDPIALVKKDINDVKDNMLISLDLLLKRGEKLEDLMDKSSDLSFSTKQFKNNTRKLNCCSIL